MKELIDQQQVRDDDLNLMHEEARDAARRMMVTFWIVAGLLFALVIYVVVKVS